ncbi:type II toxin-antitoxin system Phd/YefM family antitoxin [Candidatus Poribacteria bacterium]|nr:type II toxin-antitoxin system Phd/YefM family antitoxin [Candidatus Poribacteria bacterium]
MSQTISLDQLPRKAENLLRGVWEGHESIVIERDGKPVAAVVPMNEYLRLYPETEKVDVKTNEGRKTETTAAPSLLSYELPADLLAAYHRLLNKKFSFGLMPDEEAELTRLDQQLDEAELATPLVQSILTTAEDKHE